MLIIALINQKGRGGETTPKRLKNISSEQIKIGALMMALFVYTFARRTGGG